MSFEERLLMELKTEIGRRGRRRRLLRGGLVASLGAVAAGVAVPLLIGTATPAYAITKNPDGTILVQVKEFRDADRLERDLKGAGVRADVRYLQLGTRCAGSTLHLDGTVAMARSGGVAIDPRRLRSGQTLILEVSENRRLLSAGGEKFRIMTFYSRVVDGPAPPCKLVKRSDPRIRQMPG
ncbi:MAG: hypothetical protein HOY71_25800 [Nonomuraea sp.]|nr:hypothetical protein [Nonomuraea sp.]